MSSAGVISPAVHGISAVACRRATRIGSRGMENDNRSSPLEHNGYTRKHVVRCSRQGLWPRWYGVSCRGNAASLAAACRLCLLRKWSSNEAATAAFHALQDDLHDYQLFPRQTLSNTSTPCLTQGAMGNTTRESRIREKMLGAKSSSDTMLLIFPNDAGVVQIMSLVSSGLLGPSISSRQYVSDTLC